MHRADSADVNSSQTDKAPVMPAVSDPAPLSASASDLCVSCAAPLLAGAKFCKKCGTMVAASSLATSNSQASPTLRESTPSSPVMTASASKQTPTNRVDSVDTPSLTIEQLSVKPASSTETQLTVPASLPPLPNSSAPVTAPEIKPTHRVDPVAMGSPPILKSSRVGLAISLVLVVIAASGGGFLWWSGKKSDNIVTPAPTEAAKAEVVAVPPSIVLPVSPLPGKDAVSADSAPAQPTPTPLGPVTVEKPVPEPEPAHLATPEPAHKEILVSAHRPAPEIKPASAAAQNAHVATPMAVPDTMARKVTALLAKADGYIANRQYDKAIATAESVLELEPTSTAATAMLNKAKTKQMDVLKSGSSIE